jgi:hypothetical protein
LFRLQTQLRMINAVSWCYSYWYKFDYTKCNTKIPPRAVSDHVFSSLTQTISIALRRRIWLVLNPNAFTRLNIYHQIQLLPPITLVLAIRPLPPGTGSHTWHPSWLVSPRVKTICSRISMFHHPLNLPSIASKVTLPHTIYVNTKGTISVHSWKRKILVSIINHIPFVSSNTVVASRK